MARGRGRGRPRGSHQVARKKAKTESDILTQTQTARSTRGRRGATNIGRMYLLQLQLQLHLSVFLHARVPDVVRMLELMCQELQPQCRDGRGDR